MADAPVMGVEPVRTLPRPWPMDGAGARRRALSGAAGGVRRVAGTALCRRLGVDDGSDDAADDLAAARHFLAARRGEAGSRRAPDLGDPGLPLDLVGLWARRPCDRLWPAWRGGRASLAGRQWLGAGRGRAGRGRRLSIQ